MLICSAIQVKNDTPCIEAQRQYLLEGSIIEGYLFDYKKILTVLSTFMTTYNFKNPVIAFTLHSTELKEELSFSPYETHKPFDGYYWQEIQLQHDLFYRVGIKYELLFQYQLLMFAGKLKVVALTTPLMTLLSFHKKYTAHVPLPNYTSIENIYDFILQTAKDYLSVHNFAKNSKDMVALDSVAEILGLYVLAQKTYEIN